MAKVAGADRVILLGDVLEMRDRPVGDVVRIAAPFFADLAEAVGGAQVVVVPGNHDHHLVEPWLERRMLEGAAPLELEQHTEPDGALAALARVGGGVELDLAYPGIWLADGVYATHGHYLDRHLTIPTFERLGVGAVERLLGMHTTGPDPLDPPGADEPPGPDQYERAQGPIYALLYALAQGAEPDRVGAGNPTLRLWRSVARGSSPSKRARNWLLGSVAVPGAVGIANRLGLGPVQADISAGAITAAGLVAISDVVERLGIEARTVIFGHTHRRGPMPGDGDWTLPNGGRVVNTGSWVHSPTLLRATADRSPYWPGTIAVIEDGAEPEQCHLLDGHTREELAGLAGDEKPVPGPHLRN